eukprot:2537935-Rhodomonas_salina.1
MSDGKGRECESQTIGFAAVGAMKHCFSCSVPPALLSDAKHTTHKGQFLLACERFVPHATFFCALSGYTTPNTVRLARGTRCPICTKRAVNLAGIPAKDARFALGG